MAHHLANTLAGLMAVGGTMGYVKGKSVPSLVAGLTFAGLYTYSGYLIKNNADYGVEFATGTSVLLLAAMGPRAARLRKPVPVAVAVVGLVGTLYYATKLYQNRVGV